MIVVNKCQMWQMSAAIRGSAGQGGRPGGLGGRGEER